MDIREHSAQHRLPSIDEQISLKSSSNSFHFRKSPLRISQRFPNQNKLYSPDLLHNSSQQLKLEKDATQRLNEIKFQVSGTLLAEEERFQEQSKDSIFEDTNEDIMSQMKIKSKTDMKVYGVNNCNIVCSSPVIEEKKEIYKDLMTSKKQMRDITKLQIILGDPDKFNHNDSSLHKK